MHLWLSYFRMKTVVQLHVKRIQARHLEDRHWTEGWRDNQKIIFPERLKQHRPFSGRSLLYMLGCDKFYPYHCTARLLWFNSVALSCFAALGLNGVLLCVQYCKWLKTKRYREHKYEKNKLEEKKNVAAEWDIYIRTLNFSNLKLSCSRLKGYACFHHTWGHKCILNLSKCSPAYHEEIKDGEYL